MSQTSRALFHALIAGTLVACSSAGDDAQPEASTMAPVVECDADNGGLVLPEGFCAAVFADVEGNARHIVARANGDVFVAMAAGRGGNPAGGVMALRDTTGDGKADVRVRFGPATGGTGIALRGDELYFAPNDGVVRYRIAANALEPAGEPETIVQGLPSDRSHAAKSIALGPDGRLFVNIGSPSNACQGEDRQPGVAGVDPCPELETRAGIWVFDSNATGQTQADGQRFATGIRNAVALTFDPAGQLWAMQHGRDQLAGWPALFTPEQSAEKPAEEMLQVDEGDDFGWPYCFHDPETNVKVLAPEYGGDGAETGRCAEKEAPVFAFPGHWAPNGILFYTGHNFPARYRNGVFIAFHGSWNRAPMPQAGYNVSFLTMTDGVAGQEFEVFADGFAGADKSPGGAEHRPVGLAEGPNGSLFITEDESGRIWRVVYRGGS
jgi:glucose/arabinose dehydrogenase